MDDLMFRKNIAAIEQSLKSNDELIRAQEIRIDGLMTTIGSLYERMNELEKALLMMRVKSAGRGSSV